MLNKLFRRNVAHETRDHGFSMEDALVRLSERQVEVNTVIDVGASDGSWALLCMKYFPRARYFLIEAQQPHEVSLQALKEKYTNVDYIISAAGSRNGEIYFDATDLFGGLASERPFDENSITVPVVTIDSEIKKRSLAPPYLIKLDTHGYELPIISGGSEVLAETNAIVAEVYNFKIADECLRFFEFCAYLDKNEFLPIDIVDVVLRPGDDSLWQMDMVFLRKDRKEFQNNSYS
jgi:FkbM family methyltransferase